MITKFENYVNEEFEFKSDDFLTGIGDKFSDKLFSKMKYSIHYPLLKYIERKVSKLSDEEKLNTIGKIAHNLDLIFSPLNSLIAGLLGSLGLLVFTGMQVSDTECYIYFVCWFLYAKMSKEYRLLAKKSYQKIKNEYIEKYQINKNQEDDPYEEEEWEDDNISTSDKFRYKNKKFLSIYEDMPLIGLRKNKDVK